MPVLRRLGALDEWLASGALLLMLGIPLLDHLIIGDEGLYSFSEQNQMRPQTP